MEDIAKTSQTNHGNCRASPIIKYPNTTRGEPQILCGRADSLTGSYNCWVRLDTVRKPEPSIGTDSWEEGCLVRLPKQGYYSPAGQIWERCLLMPWLQHLLLDGRYLIVVVFFHG